MSFPDDPLDVHVDIYIDGVWSDLGSLSDPSELGAGNRLPAQAIPVTRGRQDEQSDAPPGSVRLVLWNQDGYLTPNDPRSPLWRQDGTGWGLNTLLRVRIGSNVRFLGEVSEIVPEWPRGDLSDDLTDEEREDLGSVEESRLGYAVVNVTASGLLRRLGQRSKPLRSALQRLVTSPTNLPHIVDYWPMEDGKDAAYFATGLPESAGGTEKMLQQAWSLAADDSLWGSQALAQVASGQDAHAQATVSPRVSLLDGRWVVEWVATIPEPPVDTDSTYRIDVASTGTVATWRITIGFNVVPFVLFQAIAADGEVLVSANMSASFETEHLFGPGWRNLRLEVFTEGPDVYGSFTWSPITLGTDPTGGWVMGTTPATIGEPTAISVGVVSAPPGGIGMGHLSVHDLAAGWLIPADIGWQGEKTANRFLRLGGEENVPVAVIYGPIGSGLTEASTTREMGTQESLPFLSLLRETMGTENGVILEARSGLALHGYTRGARYNRPVKFELDARNKSQITLPLTPPTDDQTRANDVTASKIAGVSYRKADETAAEVYDQAVSFSIFDDNDVKHYAGWWYHLGTYEGARFPQITIDMALCGQSMRNRWLNARPLQDRFRVVNLPPQYPDFPLVDNIIEGYTETLAPFVWTVALNCSPAVLWDVADWDEARYANDSALTDAIDADDTTFDVTWVDTRWVDTAGYPDEFPFDLAIGPDAAPEIVTVTDIDGTGSTQTFTVTRGVKGYRRAHPAGTPVNPADAAVLML